MRVVHMRAAHARGVTGGHGGRCMHARRVGAPPPPVELQNGWAMWTTAQGYVYFSHRETGQSVWELPPEAGPVCAGAPVCVSPGHADRARAQMPPAPDAAPPAPPAAPAGTAAARNGVSSAVRRQSVVAAMKKDEGAVAKASELGARSRAAGPPRAHTHAAGGAAATICLPYRLVASSRDVLTRVRVRACACAGVDVDGRDRGAVAAGCEARAGARLRHPLLAHCRVCGAKKLWRHRCVRLCLFACVRMWLRRLRVRRQANSFWQERVTEKLTGESTTLPLDAIQLSQWAAPPQPVAARDVW